eukprot:46671-Prorocentrum_minimum.AAC.1
MKGRGTRMLGIPSSITARASRDLDTASIPFTTCAAAPTREQYLVHQQLAEEVVRSEQRHRLPHSLKVRLHLLPLPVLTCSRPRQVAGFADA